MHYQRQKQALTRGFTLLELMIVVAVIAILAAIAYPAYQDSVRKGRRAQARTAILELLQQQERFLTQRNCYLAFGLVSGTVTATQSDTCGFTTSTSVPFKTWSGDSTNSSDAYYNLSAAACPGNSSGTTLSLRDCIQITATPKITDGQVGNLVATSTGTRSCTGSAASSNPKLCWP